MLGHLLTEQDFIMSNLLENSLLAELDTANIVYNGSGVHQDRFWVSDETIASNAMKKHKMIQEFEAEELPGYGTEIAEKDFVTDFADDENLWMAEELESYRSNSEIPVNIVVRQEYYEREFGRRV